MKTKLLVAALAAAGIMGLASTAAQAEYIELKVTSNGIVATNGATFSGTSASVAITPGTNINGVSLDTTTGNIIDTPSNAVLTLDTLSTKTGSGTKTVTYMLSVTGVSPDEIGSEYWNELFEGTNPNSGAFLYTAATKKVWLDPGDHLYGTSAAFGAISLYDSTATGCISTTAASYTCTAGPTSFPTLTSPYSITEVLVVSYKSNSTGKQVHSFDKFAVIPEPGSLALLGSGLLIAGWVSRRRKRVTPN